MSLILQKKTIILVKIFYLAKDDGFLMLKDEF